MKTIKKIKYLLILFLAIPFMISCDDNAIEFKVKSDFTLVADVTTTSVEGTIVSDFEVTSEIDLSEKIDNIEDISTLLITGVELELRDYTPHATHLTYREYFDDELQGDLTVTLLSNNSNKVIFSDHINLGTNVGPNHYTNDGSDYTNAQPVVLQINPTEAVELIENNEVQLQIKMTNGVIRSHAFKISIKVKSEAITGL